MNYKISLIFISQIRMISTAKALNQQKNHYKSLGIEKKATSADVKSAYYELSKVYHPDRNQGHTLELREQHSQRFRDITEAYEVLGNVRTRKMYDKGFLGSLSHTENHQTTPEDPLHKFYKSREIRTRPPPPGGRQPIYDFDEWSRQHYGESVRKARELKQRREVRATQMKEREEYIQHEVLIYGGFFFLFMCMLFKEANDSDVVMSIVRRKDHKNSVNDNIEDNMKNDDE